MNNKSTTETVRGVSLEDIGAGVARVDAQIQVLLGQMMAQRRSAQVAFDYLAGLSGSGKATCWALAEAAGHANWSRMQALLGRYVRDYTVLRAGLAPLAAQWLRCPDTDLIGAGVAIDESAALKKGDHTFAVSPQHAGCTGKVENCVTTVFTSYVTTTGSCWVDFDVYFPQRWASDPERRARAGVPDNLALVTKPDLAAAQIARLVSTGVPLGWVAGRTRADCPLCLVLEPVTRCTGGQPACAQNANAWAWPTCSRSPPTTTCRPGHTPQPSLPSRPRKPQSSNDVHAGTDRKDPATSTGR